MEKPGPFARFRPIAALAAAASLVASAGCKLSDSTVPPPAGLVYAVNPATYTRGTAIAPNSPSSSGGVVASWSVSPALPSGLGLDAVTGVVTGTPTTISAAAAYVVTATNAGGSATVTLTLTVNDVAPSGIAYAANPATFTLGVPAVPDAPASGGGPVVSWSVSPALPAGLALDAATGVVSGTPTALAAEAPYRVTATNSGGSASVDLVVTVNALAPASISYPTNPASWFATVPVAPDVPSFAGGQPATWEVSPALPPGLSLHPLTGVVSGTPGAPVAQAAYRVTGRNSGGSASVDLLVTVNPAPPVITAQPRPQTALAGTAATFTVAATGAGTLSYQWRKGGVAVTGATSATWVTPGASPADDGAVIDVVVTDPQGGATTSDAVRLTVTAPVANVYVANSGGGTISQFSAGADGSLVPMAVPAVVAGSGPFAVVVDPSGAWVYATNQADGTVSQYARGFDGALTPLSPATVTTGVQPGFLAVHPRGGFVYVVSTGSDQVFQYSVGPDGRLSPLPTPSVATGGSPGGIAITSNASPGYAFVTNVSDGTVSRYVLGGDGALGPLAPNATGVGTMSTIVVDPSGTHAYASNTGAPFFSQFDIGAGGQITQTALVASAGYSHGIAMDPGGRWLYTSSPRCSGTGCDVLNQFSIGAGGSLVPMTPQTVVTGSHPSVIAVDPAARFLWATNNYSDSISQYSIGPTGGLTPLSTPFVLVGSSPYGIAAAAPRTP